MYQSNQAIIKKKILPSCLAVDKGPAAGLLSSLQKGQCPYWKKYPLLLILSWFYPKQKGQCPYWKNIFRRIKGVLDYITESNQFT